MSIRTAPRYVYDAADGRDLERALDDLRRGTAQWRLAARLALLDLRNRFRGSVLGPIWITLSLAVTVGALGTLYPLLFRVQTERYVPHLAAGLIVWSWVQQALTDACQTFIAAEPIIRQVRLPYTVHVLRNLFRSALNAALTVPVFVVVAVIFGVAPGVGTLFLPLGLAVMAVALCAAAFFLGMVSARFRDVPPVVASVLQLAFFVTPILWKAEQLGEHRDWLLLNPVFPLLESVRAPMLGYMPDVAIWLAALGYAGVASALAFALFVRLRRRIAFWV